MPFTETIPTARSSRCNQPKSTPQAVRCAWLSFAFGLMPAALLSAENWTHWRGPHANGTAPLADPPTAWDGASGKNIRWRTELVGKGSATPIIWGDQVFIVSAEQTDRKAKPEEIPDPKDRVTPRKGYERQTTEPTDFFRFIVTSYHRGTGKEIWRKVVAELVPHEGHHATHSYAAGSPTTDGERLYVSFGSFGIFCFDLNGKPLWERQLGRLTTRRGYGEAVTPVLHQGRLLINWDQEWDSALYCLDAKTGETKWKADRDEITTWTTPFVTEFNGKTQVILNGTRSVRSHDLETGRVIWSCGGMTENAIPAALRYQDAAIILSGYRGNSGVSVPLSSQGDLGLDGPVNWRTKSGNPYVPSPVLVGDQLYFTKHLENVLTVRDAATGTAVIDGERIPGLAQLYSSPVYAGGRVYFTDRNGVTVVLKPGPTVDVVATNALKEGVDASLVAVGKQLFVRGQKSLFCIETKE
jgi:outer membrane protein assembly factor BamB